VRGGHNPGWDNASWEDYFDIEAGGFESISSDATDAEPFQLHTAWSRVMLSQRSRLWWASPADLPEVETVTVYRLIMDREKLASMGPLGEQWLAFCQRHWRKPVFLTQTVEAEQGESRIAKYDGHLINTVYGLFRGFERNVHEVSPDIASLRAQAASLRVGFRQPEGE